MVKRKIVKTGQNTLIISLPVNWIRKNKLEKGQFVELEETEGVLKIYPTEKAKKTLKMKLNEEGYWYINRILRKIYAAGYDLVEIEYSNDTQRESIRKSVSFLDGFEIIKSEKNTCILKNILTPDKLEYKDLIENIMWLIRSQLEIFKESAIKGTKNKLKEISGIHETVIKLAHLGRRILNLESKQDIVILKDSFLLFTDLLYLSSYLNFAAQELTKKTKSMDEEEQELVTETLELYEKLLYAYKTKSLSEVQDFFQKRDDTFERDIKLLNNKNPDIIHFLLDFRKEMVGIGNYLLSISFEEKLNAQEKN
jgi:phosphate uptake regulator